MSVAGLGVDIVEIDRMRKVLARTPSFKNRVFSEGERAYCEARAIPEIHYALRFAAKEAVLKALGTGFAGVAVTDVEVENDEKGRPHAVLHGKAKQIADEQGVMEMHISLSYTHEVGVANAVAITEENRPHEIEKPQGPVDLDAAFKQARSLLDEEPTSPEKRTGGGESGSGAASPEQDEEGAPGAQGALGDESEHERSQDALARAAVDPSARQDMEADGLV